MMITPDLAERLHRRGVDIPGSSGRVDFHHSVITRQDALGLSPEEHEKIDDEHNILVIDHEAHLSFPPTRQMAIRLLLRHYSYDELKEWYSSIKWRGEPPFVFPAEDEL